MTPKIIIDVASIRECGSTSTLYRTLNVGMPWKQIMHCMPKITDLQPTGLKVYCHMHYIQKFCMIISNND